MNNEINYKNNPLNGVSLKKLLIEIEAHYGFEILFAYLNINCFKTNPSIESSVKFLKKTGWAREKVEAFYMYQYKNLPRACSEQFLLPPRDRIIPEDDVPGEPAELNLEDAEYLREMRAKKWAERDHGSGSGKRYGSQRGQDSRDYSPKGDDSSGDADDGDPWANWRNKE